MADVSQQIRRGVAGLFLYLGLMLFGFIFMVGPFILPDLVPSFQLGGGARTMLMVFGILVFGLGAVLSVVTRLYVKANSDLAWVRTGMGGQKAVVNGGILQVPFAHNMTPVSLRTMKLVVKRAEKEALITGDKLRADVHSEFYIKVQRDEGAVLAAATSLGSACIDEDQVMTLVQEKLISALRTVAATKTLDELNSQRKEFAEEVQKIVTHDLAPNGLTLESVTISHLDQTAPGAMNGVDNIFDAKGLQAIAVIVNAAKIARSKTELDAQRLIKEQEVETAKVVNELTVKQQKAAAETQLAVSQAQSRAEAETAKAKAEAMAMQQKAEAEARSDAAQVSAEKDREAQEANVARDKAVQLKKVEMQQALEVAGKQREQATEVAAVESKKAQELALLAQQIAVQNKEAERANAEAARLLAEKERETAKQAVTTVEVEATANRAKAKAIIEKEAQTAQERLEQQNNADLEAYRRVKAASGEQEAAEKQSAAVKMMAEANKEAELLKAAGQQAIDMIPVNVKLAEAEALRKSLEAQSQFDTISRDLKIQLAKIEADRDARIAIAKAQGEALAAAKMTIFGDPTTFAMMSRAFNNGMAFGQVLEGAAETTPTRIKELGAGLAESLGNGLEGLMSGIGSFLHGKGIKLTPEQIQAALTQFIANQGNDAGSTTPPETPPTPASA